jgi:hypothetical protein
MTRNALFSLAFLAFPVHAQSSPKPATDTQQHQETNDEKTTTKGTAKHKKSKKKSTNKMTSEARTTISQTAG